MLNLIIIGAGRGGTALMELLHNDPHTKILGVADRNKTAPGMILAKKLKIRTATDYRKLEKLKTLQCIVDTTGDKSVRKELEKRRRPNVELISGTTARHMWRHMSQGITRKTSLEQMLFQYQSIYDLGLKLSSTQHLPRLLFYTLEDATKLTNTSAGSIALFDERRGEMYHGVMKGFSASFSNMSRWILRQGGLTSSILNHEEPLVIADVLQHPQFDNPIMLKEGIRSLMATPLIADGKIIGILYVNDFVVRKFTSREISLFSLLGGMAANIIEKAQLLENAMRISITDDLTGLYNHRYFSQRLLNEIKRAERYGLTFTLLMIDIDNFKQYNDTHGHPKGNEVLRQMGEIFKNQCREVDVVARYGGEEFAVIMPETSPEKVVETVNIIREKVATFPFVGRETQRGGCLTISVGISSYHGDGQEAHTLIEQADEALYEAKRLGKNRVIVSTSSKIEGKSIPNKLKRQAPPKRIVHSAYE